MKCDLCKRDKLDRNTILCGPCAEMIQRLVSIEARTKAPEACAAARLAGKGAAAGQAA
jgi:hypothetical protein